MYKLILILSVILTSTSLIAQLPFSSFETRNYTEYISMNMYASEIGEFKNAPLKIRLTKSNASINIGYKVYNYSVGQIMNKGEGKYIITLTDRFGNIVASLNYYKFEQRLVFAITGGKIIEAEN